MNGRIRFSSEALVGTNKAGIIKPDEFGYYTLVLGGVNTFNSAGAFYKADGIETIMQASSPFMRRVKSGKLYGERGHPKKLPAMSDDEYLLRARSIYEDCISHHIRDVWLDDTSFVDPGTGKPIIAFMGLVKPDDGPIGLALRTSLENPHQNTCFSIRCFTADKWSGGILNKVMKEIITWDWVVEQGIAIAEKYKNPSLESFVDMDVTPNTLMKIAKREDHGVSMECSIIPIDNLFDAFGMNKQGKPLSLSLK